MLNNRYIFLFLTIVLVGFLFTINSASASTFNPNFIISNEEMMDSGSMSLSEIQVFLSAKGSYLANYRCANYAGVVKSAAEIIYEAATNNYDCDDAELSRNLSDSEKEKQCRKISINPKLLLVLLQKEQSLIEDASPSQRSLDWATGYGCPDSGGCNSHWQGFGKQVNSAALQFFDYLTNPLHYSYKAGLTYTVTNTNRPPSIVTPVNHATAALYNYTPHVYNGNFNFWNLWMRYFTVFYLDGSLLQVKGEPGVWLIQGGKKRPFLSKGALTTRFDLNKVIQVNKADLDLYPTGEGIKFPQYSLIRSPRGTIFLLVDDKRRGFASAEAFRLIGYNPEEVIDASWEDINTYEEAAPITATTSYPMGALLQDKTTGGIYYVFENTKAPLWDAVLLKTKFKRQAIFPIEPEKLANYKTVEPAIFSDGELLKSESSPAVYVVASKSKHPFVSGKAFEELGYKWENVVTVPDKILNLYIDGDPILEKEEETATTTPNIVTPEDKTATDTIDCAGSTTEEIMECVDKLGTTTISTK